MSAIETLWETARILIDVPERRKVLVYISGGVPLDLEEAATPRLAEFKLSGGPPMAEHEVVVHAAERAKEIFTQASRANVSIYAFDVCGMRLPATRPGACDAPAVPPDLNIDFIQTVAGSTGGRAAVRTADFQSVVTQIFRETSSYYLLGYESSTAKGPGHFRRLDVRVNRPDVEVRSRSRHFTELPETARRGAPMSPATKALAGLLPAAEIPLAAQLAPFAIPGRRDLAAVVVTMALRQPRDPAAPGAIAADMDWEVRAFDPEGRPRGRLNQRAGVRLRPGDAEIHLQLLTRMDLKPGPYQLRLAIHDAGRKMSGSVYADVEVPDFSNAPVSLSGVLLSSSSAPPTAPRDGLPGLLPIVPTSGRMFANDDLVTAFVRVYQGGDPKKPSVPLTVTTRITGGSENLIVNRSQTVDSARFIERSADVRFDMPLAALQSGPYLLTFEVTLGRTTARRDVRFEVR